MTGLNFLRVPDVVHLGPKWSRYPDIPARVYMIAVGPPPPGIAIHEANQAQLRGQQRARLRRPPGALAAAQADWRARESQKNIINEIH